MRPLPGARTGGMAMLLLGVYSRFTVGGQLILPFLLVSHLSDSVDESGVPARLHFSEWD